MRIFQRFRVLRISLSHVGDGGEWVQIPVNDLAALAQTDPAGAILATDSYPSVERNRDDVIALRARAVAHRVLGNAADALSAMAVARTIAHELEDPELDAACLISHAALLAQSGDTEAAFDALTEAETIGTALHLAEVEFQRAGIWLMVADWRRSMEHYTNALEVFRSEGQHSWVAEALLGRGLMFSYLGRHDDAVADLDLAKSAFDELDDQIGVGQAAWNGALATLMRGDPARAVTEFDAAAEFLDGLGFPVDLFRGDQCQALFAVGLHEEAVELGERCVAAFDLAAEESESESKARNVLDAASRRLELCQAHARVGDLDAAERHAQQAESAFAAQGQRLRQRHAELVLLDISYQRGLAPSSVAERSREIFDSLRGGGQAEWQSMALLLEARSYAALDDHRRAHAVLAQVGRRYRSTMQELERLQLAADLDLRAGKHGAALRRCRRALRLVSDGPRLGGTSFVEAAVTRHVQRATETGLAALLRSGRSRDALDFADQAELALYAHRRPRETPALVAEYRSLSAAIDEAINDLRDPSEIIERRSRVAQQIRATQTELHDVKTPITSGHDRDRWVLRWVVADDQVWEIEQRAGRTTSRPIAPVAAVTTLMDELMFVLRQAMFSSGSRDVVSEVAEQLDALLGRPGKDYDAQMHLVPSSQLPSVAYGLLPSLAGVRWARGFALPALATPSSAAGVTVVGGARLEHAATEAELVASLYPDTTPLSGDDATIASVLEAIGASGTVHIAAHSTLEPADPMFSSIELADGPAYLHEFESLASVPLTMVLASCDSAREGRVGTSSVGLASGLVRSGIETVIGTALVIPDCAETTEAMAELHRCLLEVPPVEAVQRVHTSTTLSTRARLIAQSMVACSRCP